MMGTLPHRNFTCTNARNVTINGNTTTFYDDCKVATRMVATLDNIGTGYQTLMVKGHGLQVKRNVSFSSTIFAPVIVTGSNEDTSYKDYKWGHGPPTYLVNKVSPGVACRCWYDSRYPPPAAMFPWSYNFASFESTSIPYSTPGNPVAANTTVSIRGVAFQNPQTDDGVDETGGLLSINPAFHKRNASGCVVMQACLRNTCLPLLCAGLPPPTAALCRMAPWAPA